MHEAYLAQLREDISYLENQSGLPRSENRISGLPYNAEMYSKFDAYSSRNQPTLKIISIPPLRIEALHLYHQIWDNK
jgi:hypothetical protein